MDSSDHPNVFHGGGREPGVLLTLALGEELLRRSRGSVDCVVSWSCEDQCPMRDN